VIVNDQVLPNSQSEIRDLKIRLARKEKELKESNERLLELKSKDASSHADQSSLQNERDELVLKLE
jgi:hypothetical protein